MSPSHLGSLLSMLSVSTLAVARGTCSLHAACTRYCLPVWLVLSDVATWWLACLAPADGGTGCAVCTCICLLYAVSCPDRPGLARHIFHESLLISVHFAMLCQSQALSSISVARRRGDELLRKRCGLDSPKPAVDLESPALMQRLFAVFSGGDAYKGTWPSTTDPQHFLQHLEDQVAAEQREVNMEEADGGAPGGY